MQRVTRLTIEAGVSRLLLCCTLMFCLNSAAEENAVNEKLRAPVSGTLTDENGDPVDDAKITLQGPGYYRATTDDEGRYEFSDVEKLGEYKIRIESTSWVGITDYQNLPKIIVMADKPVTKDFVLQRACKIEVTVKDEDGNPVKGATVYCQRSGTQRFNRHTQASTMGNGIALLGGLESLAGQVLIGVISKEHVITTALVDVHGPDQISKQTIVLSKGKTITGKVMCSDGNPAAGWSLRALPSTWEFSVYPRGTPIGDDGSFELKHIIDQKYDLTVSIPSGDRTFTSRQLQSSVALTEMKPPLSFVLDHPSPASMKYLTGKVRWIGKPLEKGFRVSGYSFQTQQHIDGYVDAKKTEFKLGPFPPGVYRIRPESSSVEVMNLRKIKNLDDLDAVEIPNKKPIQFVLRVRGKPHVQGVVVDSKTNKPVPNYQYRITKARTLDGPNYVQDDEWRVASSEQGEFESEVVGAGVYLISVLADGYAMATSDQVNTNDEPDRMLKIQLEPGIRMQGIVVDESGKPIEGAKVRALSRTAGAMPRVSSRFVTDVGAKITTSDGKFAFDDLSGSESFRVDHPDFAFHEVKQVQVAKDAPDLKIQLSAGAMMRGTVYNESGEPLASETLFFQDANGYGGGDREAGRYGTATTDKNGNYELKHLPSGIVYVSRQDEWKSMGVVRHAVRTVDGSVHTLDFGGSAQLPGQLSGRLIANGEPLKNTRLQLAGIDPTFGAMKMYVRTDDNGRFVFFGPPAGDWHLYREIEGTRGDFSELQEVRVPSRQNVDLGETRLRIGRLTIEPLSDEPVSVKSYFRLLQYNPLSYMGREASKPVTRLKPEDPIAFDHVSPGTYQLTFSGTSKFAISQIITLTGDDVDKPVEFPIPAASATLLASITSSDGTPSESTFSLRSADKRITTRLTPNTEDESQPYLPVQLPTGKYELTAVSYQNDAIAIAEVELVEGENKIKIDLKGAAELTEGNAVLSVTDENGILIPIKPEYVGEGSDKIVQRIYLPEMVLSGPPGDYSVKFNLPGFEPQETSFSLNERTPDAMRSDEIILQLERVDSP